MDVRRPRFDADFDFDGEWWLPGQEVQIPGKLYYTPAEGIRVECGRRLIPVSGTFRPGPQTVHGKTRQDRPVTLLDAHGSWGGSSTVGSQSIVAAGLVVGAAVKSWEAPIKGMTLSIDDLSVWKSQGPFSEGYSPESTGPTISYHYDVSLEPEPSHFVDAINANASILSSVGSVGGGHKITLSHECTLDFQFKEETTLTTAVGIAYQVELLFTLLTGTPTSIQRIELSLEPEDELFRPDIHLLFSRSRRRPVRRYYPRTDMPVPFERIKNLAELLNSWFAVGSDFSPVLNLLASSLFRPEPEFVENRFLTLAQAIEGYCRIANPDDTYLSREVFAPMRNAMLDCLPERVSPDFLQVARSRIGGLNSCSLQDRMKKLFERHEWLMLLLATPQKPTPDAESVDSFTTAVRLARNGLTHVESKPAKRPTIDEEMVWQLRAIICALLLREAGVDIGKRIAEFVWPQSRIMWWMDYFD